MCANVEEDSLQIPIDSCYEFFHDDDDDHRKVYFNIKSIELSTPATAEYPFTIINTPANDCTGYQDSWSLSKS